MIDFFLSIRIQNKFQESIYIENIFNRIIGLSGKFVPTKIEILVYIY